MRTGWTVALVVLLVAAAPRQTAAYSVLAHEAIIDATWDDSIAPLLRRRFPGMTADDLLRARSYAYGGSVIQDLGYYPFGSHFFSNLLHYVRSGDFVEALFRDAHTSDELGFACGALAHYVADNTGHPEAVNRSVPLTFPKLQREFGNAVTYVEGPKQHVIVEFSFDVVQAAGGVYLPEAYQRFVGFNVAADLLERAFLETYGLTIRDVFGNVDRSIATYRYSVSQIIPALTDAAWREKHDEILKQHPALERTGFVFAYGREEFERQYGHDYERPGWFARFLGFLYRLLPKIGPLAPLSFKTPGAEAERLFARSFQDTVARLRTELRNSAGRRFDIANTNFDTGRQARHGEYELADDTYSILLRRLGSPGRESGVPSGLASNVRAFYGPDARPSAASREDRKHWKETASAVAALNR